MAVAAEGAPEKGLNSVIALGYNDVFVGCSVGFDRHHGSRLLHVAWGFF